jgi:aspartate-semialdehyde dehydrogenase
MLASQQRRAAGGRAGATAAPSRPVRARAVSVRAAKTADGPRIAIVGVTGAVGQEFLTVRWWIVGRKPSF